jgi:hypothetical protein
MSAFLSIGLEHILFLRPASAPGSLPHIASGSLSNRIYYLPPDTGEGIEKESTKGGIRHMNSIVDVQGPPPLELPHVEAQAIMDTQLTYFCLEEIYRI